MEKSYLDYEGLSHTIAKIDQKKQDVIQVTTFPTSPADGQIVQYVGEDTDELKNGFFYKYDETEETWNNINVAKGAVNPSERDFTYDGETGDLELAQPTFIGTQDEWDALDDEEKVLYSEAHITDDDSTGMIPYSLTETKTGEKWINGKPVYRMVLPLGSPITASAYSWGGLEDTIAALNIEQPLRCYGLSNDKTFVGTIVFSLLTGFKSYTNTGVDTPGGYLIIEYTKA